MYALDDVARLVDPGTLQRGISYAKQGNVLAHVWSRDRSRLYGTVRGSHHESYTVEIGLSQNAQQVHSGSCTCPMVRNCKHVVAVLLAVKASGDRGSAAASRSTGSEWRRVFDTILPDETDLDDSPLVGLALQLEFAVVTDSPRMYSAPPRKTGRLKIRPMREGAKGAWIKTGAAWSDLDSLAYSWRAPDYDPAQVAALIRVRSEFTETRSRYSYSSTAQNIYFDEMTSEAGWVALEQLALAGVPIIDASKGHEVIAVRAAEWGLDIRVSETALTVQPQILLDGQILDHGRMATIGAPVTGCVTWPDGNIRTDTRPSLWRFRLPIPAEAAAFITAGTVVTVPQAEVADFLAEQFPRLGHQFPWRSSDETFTAPEPPEPTLGLTLAATPGHRVSGYWWMSYDAPGSSHERRRPVSWRASRSREPRHEPAEQELVTAALAALGEFSALRDDGVVPSRLVENFELPSRDFMHLLQRVVPELREQGVVVELDERIPDYRESSEEPSIHISASQSEQDGGRDWFDLVVRVLVEGHEIEFETIFVALATGRTELVLPDGLHVSLDGERFDQLRELIEEARLLGDSPTAPLRLSRFQATLWDDLAALGIVDEQAEAWRRAAASFRPEETITRQQLPENFTATLREYQHDGYDWMCFLGDHDLGGILADDMGLGKTVQALAFVARQRARPDDRGPFIVVAPTSVVGNWAAESSKFAPTLEVLVLNETHARRGAPLEQLLAERAEAGHPVDLVVTSYAIFRLDFDDFAGHSWSGLLMDEAQFLKNHQSVAYQCARKLTADIKIAITGTPMENNLMELWSLMSIVAPGLFPSPKRFADYYAKPIEREGNSERLEQLKRRMRPLTMRRTKEQVASDLPQKQEQILEVELNPAHRRVYDTYLARERKKILGLVDELDANRFEIFRSLTLLRQASLDVSLVDPAHSAVSSTKLDLLDTLLADIVSEGHRVLVFSQFTTFLDRARQRLEASGVAYAYLDGRTRNRAAVIERFRNEEVPVFFISLKAGGFGLNLTEADYCILLDPWWNPAAEAQAVDRTHRIGQTRNVMVYRLVSRGTIEDKVMALKSAKSRLFASVMSDDGAAGSTAITATDIRSLLE